MTAPGLPGCLMAELQSKAPALNQARPQARKSAKVPWEMPWPPGKGDDSAFVFVFEEFRARNVSCSKG